MAGVQRARLMVRGPTPRTGRGRDPAATSRIMAAVRGRDTRPEMMLRRELHARGLRFRVHPKDVPGRPDIVNRGRRVAVFVDGDFWHANPREWERRGFARMEDQFPLEKRDKWSTKLARNTERDRDVTRRLVEEGWTVVRVWESDVRADVSAVAAKVEAAW
jgi:DNA mismatch endonuclease (patch repair protein)